jgi:hypothetical protein
MMKRVRSIAIAIFTAAFLHLSLCSGQSPLPSADINSVAEDVQRNFGSIDEIYTIGMTDDPGGRFDIIVVGSRP